jgi:hypothetical protein
MPNRQIATFRMNVSSAPVKKMLSKGRKKNYRYGSIAVQSPKLEEYIGKEVMIRVFGEQKDKRDRK